MSLERPERELQAAFERIFILLGCAKAFGCNRWHPLDEIGRHRRQLGEHINPLFYEGNLSLIHI